MNNWKTTHSDHGGMTDRLGNKTMSLSPSNATCQHSMHPLPSLTATSEGIMSYQNQISWTPTHALCMLIFTIS